MAEGGGRGGTSGGRGGDCGHQGGPPGTLGAVAQLAAAERGAAGCRASWHDRLCRRSLRVRNLGIGPIRRGLAHEFDLIGRLICRGGVRIGQTQLTILRLHMPWAGLQGVRAQRPTLCRFGPDLTHGHVRVGDLCLAVPGSHRESPGDPGGALHGPWTVPTARRREILISGGREGVNKI